MPCPKSLLRAPADPLELAEAVAAVAESTFFAFAEPTPAAPTAIDAGVEWVEASVAFSGALGGRLSCWLPSSLARELCESFSGESANLLEHSAALADAIGEFTNMICGTWLTRATALQAAERPPVPFTLSPPAVRVAAEVGCDDAVIVQVNDQPVLVRVALDGE